MCQDHWESCKGNAEQTLLGSTQVPSDPSPPHLFWAISCQSLFPVVATGAFLSCMSAWTSELLWLPEQRVSGLGVCIPPCLPLPGGCSLKRGLNLLVPCQGGTSPKVQLSSRAPHRTQVRLGHLVSCPTVLLYLLCTCSSWEPFLLSPLCRNPGL